MTSLIRDARPPSRIPSPRHPPLLGHLLEFQRSPLPCLSRAARLGSLVRLQLGPLPLYLVSAPAGVQHVLQDHGSNYRKGLGYQLMMPLVGESLLTTEGELWLGRRRLIQPSFHRRELDRAVPLITDVTSTLLARWHTYARDSRSFELTAEMIGLSRQIVGQLLFGIDVSDTADPLCRALVSATELSDRFVLRHISSPLALLGAAGLFPARPDRSLARAVEELDGPLFELIRERRVNPHQDLLSMLLQARPEGTGSRLTDRQVRNEALTLFLAGNETTAIALTWSWYLLAQNPGAEDRLHAELDAIGGRTPTLADLPQLSYARMVVEEAMRLFPPGWMILRRAIASDELLGWPIPAGAHIILSPYVTHRLPWVWENPDRFEPERFAPASSKARAHFAYFPFGGGIHQCIGNHLATLQTQLVVAMVAQHYRVRLAPQPPVEPRGMITLRPRRGIQVTLESRTPYT